MSKLSIRPIAAAPASAAAVARTPPGRGVPA